MGCLLVLFSVTDLGCHVVGGSQARIESFWYGYLQVIRQAFIDLEPSLSLVLTILVLIFPGITWALPGHPATWDR